MTTSISGNGTLAMKADPSTEASSLGLESATGILTSDFANQDNSRKKKRVRPVVVCTHCRRRKIKCDKQLPCSNCVKVNLGETCNYDPKIDRKEGDDYPTEVRFPFKDLSTSQLAVGANQGFVGLFALDGRKPKKSKKEKAPEPQRPQQQQQQQQPRPVVPPKFSTKPEPNLPSKPDANVTVRRSELDFLKQRLQQIENSLLGSTPRVLGQTEQLHPANPQFLVPPDPQGVPSMVPHMPRPNELGPPFSQHRYSHPGIASPLYQLPFSQARATQDPSPHSLLPPFSAHFKLSEPAETPPAPGFAYIARNGIENIFDKPETRDGSISSGVYGSNLMSGPGTASTDTNTSNDVPTPKSGLLTGEEFMIGHNIYGNASDSINFYEHYSSVHVKDPLRKINFGPFAWSSLLRRDFGLRLVWDHIMQQKEKDASKAHSAVLLFAQQDSEITPENTNTILSADKYVDHLEKQFQKRALQADGYDELIPYKSIIRAREEKNIRKATLNRSTLPLGLTFYDGQIDRELQLIDKVHVVLPKKKVVWKLIHRYFTWVYTYMPFLDEGYFKRDVERIIGPEGYEDVKISEIKIERKLDLATVGLLLIVLRLAYLSLFSNNSELNELILMSDDPSPDIQGIKFLLNNPININAIDVASLCLEQFQILRRSNFSVLQLALYLRLYHTYAPEDGDGADGGDSQVLSAVLIQMAYSLGLNREPDEQSTDLRMNNLSRKIWNYLVLSDLHHSYSFGNPLTTDAIFYDTKFPFYEPGGENSEDKERDRFVTNKFKTCAFMYPSMRNILKKALDVSGRVNLPELCGMLSKFEMDWFRNLGTLKDSISCHGCDDQILAQRNLKVKIYLAIKSFLISIYFHIYLYYEPKNTEVSFFYLKKCLLTNIADIMPHYVLLLGKSEVISDMIINPTLEMNIHKANLVNLSAIVRVNFLIYHLRQAPDHLVMCKNDQEYLSKFQLLCQFSSCLTRAAEFTISAISKISNRYYYAWRITRSQTFLLKVITSPEFYENNYSKATPLYSVRYSAEQLQELILICETTLSKFQASEFRTYGFSKQVDKECKNTSASDVSASDSSSTVNASDNVGNSEIDKLWLQVLSMKNEKPLTGNFQDTPIDTRTPIALTFEGAQDINDSRRASYGQFGATPGQPKDVDRFGYDVATKFDIFDDLPFDQMFNL